MTRPIGYKEIREVDKTRRNKTPFYINPPPSPTKFQRQMLGVKTNQRYKAKPTLAKFSWDK
jgi:hypothetical protein